MSLLKLLKEDINNKLQGYIDRVQKSENFKKWFKDSKVVTSDGDPLIVFHGTIKDFDEFGKGDIGYHFGTDEAAKQRLRHNRQVKPSEYVGARTGAFFLSIQNPLMDVDDAEAWHDFEDVHYALHAYLEEEENFDNELYEQINDMDSLRKFILDMGIDGIQYTNFHEDSGSESWIAFKPEQIKSIWNNGEFNPSSKKFNEGKK